MQVKAQRAPNGAQNVAPKAQQAEHIDPATPAQTPTKAGLSVRRKLSITGIIIMAALVFFVGAEWNNIRDGFLQAHNAKIVVKRVAPLDPSLYVLVDSADAWELRYQGRVVATMKATFARNETRYKVVTSLQRDLKPGNELVFATQILPTVSSLGLARCENCTGRSLPLLWTLS
ncbi:MAG: hypothetical protein ING37_00770 [Rhodocyclaceae bacterium]|nr:hypothetical protein [Rhodocyclaceae bacterium]MCA3039122.1 hypothetical protein [Rhodocyclaceae bacterium]